MSPTSTTSQSLDSARCAEHKAAAGPATKPRDTALDLLRIAAIAAVVMLHVANQHCREAFPGTDWVVRVTADALVRWCVPVFLMISGALFLNPARQVTLRHLYGRNLVRVAVAFFVWSYVYSFARINAAPWHEALRLLLAGPGHLWFLKVIAGLYIVVPVLRVIAASREAARYFIIVAVAVMTLLLGLTLCRQHCNTTAVDAVRGFINAMHLRVATGYAAYFMLGHCLHSCTEAGRRRLIYACGAAAWIAMIAGTIAYSHRTGHPVNWFVNYLTPTVLALSAAVFAWGTSRRVELRGRWRRVVVEASKLSFGVYLVHQLVLRTALHHGISSALMPPAIGIPIFTLAAVLVSYAVSWLIGRIPFISRYII